MIFSHLLLKYYHFTKTDVRSKDVVQKLIFWPINWPNNQKGVIHSTQKKGEEAILRELESIKYTLHCSYAEIRIS